MASIRPPRSLVKFLPTLVLLALVTPYSSGFGFSVVIPDGVGHRHLHRHHHSHHRQIPNVAVRLRRLSLFNSKSSSADAANNDNESKSKTSNEFNHSDVDDNNTASTLGNNQKNEETTASTDSNQQQQHQHQHPLATATTKKKIPVHLLAGFLGSGKTTTLKYVLENKEDIRVGVIVNDVASVNIDAKLIAQKDATSLLAEGSSSLAGAETEATSSSDDTDNNNDIVELQNGCACCSLAGELFDSIDSLLRPRSSSNNDSSYDAIVVELSGVADPLAIRNYWREVVATDSHPGVTTTAELGRIVTVVDATTFGTDYMTYDNLKDREGWLNDDKGGYGNAAAAEKKTSNDCSGNKQVAYLLAEQVEAADLVVVNKEDLAGNEKVKVTRSMVQSLNADGEVLVTSHGNISAAKLLGLLSQPLEAAGEEINDEHDSDRDTSDDDLMDSPSSDECNDADCTDESHSHTRAHSHDDHDSADNNDANTDAGDPSDAHSHDHSHDDSACDDTDCMDPSHDHSHSHDHDKCDDTDCMDPSHDHFHSHDDAACDDTDCTHPSHDHSHSHDHNNCEDTDCADSSHDHSHSHDHHNCEDTDCTDPSHDHSHSHGHGSCNDADCTDPSHDHSHSHDHATDTSLANLGISNFVYKATRPFHANRLMRLLFDWPIPIKDELDAALLGAAKSGYAITKKDNDNSSEENEDNDNADDNDSDNEENSPFIGVLRSKGFCWIGPTAWDGLLADVWRHDRSMYWSHAGKHMGIQMGGPFWDSVPRSSMEEFFQVTQNPRECQRILKEDFVTEEFGDRRQELVFIGVELRQKDIEDALDGCLLTGDEMEEYRAQLEKFTRLAPEVAAA